jgi:flagella basal body P-ring formation protein FlgA
MKLFLICFFISSQLFAQDSCEINSYAQIFKINNVIDDSIIKSSDCSSEIINNFITLVTNANGKLNASYLSQYFKSEYKTSVELSPKNLTVKQLKTVLEEKLSSSTKMVSSIKSLYGKSSFTLDENELLQVSCSSCNSAGEKNIKITSNKGTTWISAIFLVNSEAYRARKSLNRMSPLLLSTDFEQINTSDRGRTRYFTDIENIQFYKLNKDLREGDLIKSHDLSPKRLVNFGQKVKLTIKNKFINLKTIGIAKKSGKIGDFIEIQNPKTKKVFLGKITDFNKAVVDL